MEELGSIDDIDNHDDCQSELTEDDCNHNVMTGDSTGLFDNLQRNWSTGDLGYWEQACFAAFCCIFYDPKSPQLPPPHRVVVTGLWGNVVLPSLLGPDSNQIPQLVAQEIWDVLRTKLQYIAEDGRNAVTLAHSVYRDYGQKLAEHADTKQWKHDFAAFLQNSLDGVGDQPHFVQLYASQVIVPYWLSLGKVTQAASLLHQPSFLSKEWGLLSKEENVLQVTARHVKLVELYLEKLPPSSIKWQEALGLYQGWHTLLQQEMQINLVQPADTSSDRSQGSGGSSTRSSSKRRSRRSRSPKSRRKVNPMQLLILGKSLFVLSVSLDSILTEFPGKDPAVSVLWRRQAEYLAEAMQVLSQVEDGEQGGTKVHGVQYLLSAATWLSMSASCATVEECDVDDLVNIDVLAQLHDVGDIAKGETDELQCLNVARILLGMAEPSKKSKTMQLVYLSLKAELQDAWGRWLYNKQRYIQARLPLEEATKVRRQVLALLKDTQPDSATLFWWGSTPVNESEDETEAVCHQLCLHLPDTERQVQETEVSLARSLEYAALALHACDLSMAAMSWLQEALVLKTSHLGKMSLEVARLNAAMAIVNEDLLQWEAGLMRYRECLRIRMHLLSQKDPDEWCTTEHDLFRSILETIASMGSVYRILGDHDNAVGCYWKIATMTKTEWESLNRTATGTAFWGFEAHRRMAADSRTMPLPTLVLDEERYSKTPFEISPPQKSPLPQKNDNHDAENAILFQAAHAYQTILSLFEDKASKTLSVSGNLAASVAVEDVPLLLASSYRLGLIHVHFGDFRSAISSMEHALHALWVLDPSSSDSSSEEDEGQGYSREVRRRQRVLRGIFGKEMETVDDEGVYHALGMCRAACGEHDQAVRLHLTALRCARRMYGVNSIQASEILYDAAISYWYLKDYDKAEEFWAACLRIRSTKEEEELNKSGDKLCVEKDLNDSCDSACVEKDSDRVFDSDSIEHARILYNVGASLCAMGRYSDARTQESLEKAKRIFANRVDSQSCVEVANCLFYMANVQLRKASSVDVLLLKTASVYLNRASSIYRTLGYLRPGSDSGFHQEPLHLNNALQAHIRYMEASISENLGKLHLAMDTYTAALLLYRSLDDKRWNLYVASVLNAIAKLNVLKMYHDSVALVNFEEALTLRRECLGRDHEAVGDTLYQMAEIYSRMGNLATAMEMYHEALRIQMVAEGNDGPAVAMTLQMIASLHVKQGSFELAMEKLKASLSIRKNRVELVDRASRVVSFWSGDLADDYLVLSKEEAKGEDGGHVRKTLQDDLVKEEVGLAVVLHCMGTVYVKLSEYEPAKECFEQSLRVRRAHPASHIMSPDGSIKLHVSDTLHNLGCLYELKKDYGKALRYYATTLQLKHSILSKTEEPTSDDSQEQTLAVIYTGKGSLDGRYLRSRGSICYAMTLHRLGTVHYRCGNQDIALACLGAALRMQKHYLGLHHFTVAKTLVDMASVLRNTEGKSDAARICYKEAYDIRKLRNRSNADVGHVLYHIGQLYDVEQDYARASRYYYQAIQAYGRRYVNSVSRQFYERVFLKKATRLDGELATGDMLAKDGLPVRSIEETDEMIRSHFTTVAKAIRNSSRKRIGHIDNAIMMDLDVNAPDCWISLNLYLLSLFELMHSISGRWADEARRQLGQAGRDGTRTSAEAITFQMLCLIQE
jgi:tetratricopeptide (TPR) repeat protein